MPGIVGREPELQVAVGFLDGLQTGSAALVFEGEAGIGKTTVWAEAAERARGQFCVLSAQPVEAGGTAGFRSIG